MSLVSKFTGGKRVNHTKRGGYEMRSVGAALAHTSGPGWSMGLALTRGGTIGRTQHQIFSVRERKLKARSAAKYNYKKKREFAGPDWNYGPDAAQPDINDEEMLEEARNFLLRLKSQVPTFEARDKLEHQTRGQHENEKWREIRKNMLTASNFGAVINRREKTPPHNLVKRLLYGGEVFTKSMEYGRINESVAIERYAADRNILVEKCGIFIDFVNPYLGASPDGLVGVDGIVEVKCLASLEGEDIFTTQKKKCYNVDENQIK